MKEEIFDWYASKHLEAHKQIRINLKGGLSKYQVEAALEHCYNKIVNDGKEIPDSEISRYVRSVAIDIDTTGIEEDHRLIENAKDDIAELNTKREQLISQHKSEFQKLHDDNKLKLRETTESYINIINNKNDELRKNKAAHDAELSRSEAAREVLKKKFDDDLNKEIAVTKFMSASIFKLRDQLESERKKAGRIAIFYYIFTMLLIQAGFWLL